MVTGEKAKVEPFAEFSPSFGFELGLGVGGDHAASVVWYGGAIDVVNSQPKPGVPAQKVTVLGFRTWIGRLLSPQWARVYGFLPSEITPRVATNDQICRWHVDLPPLGQYPSPSPYVRIEPDIPSVGRVVDNPSLMSSPDYFEAVVSPRSLTVTEGPPPRYSREEVSKRRSPIAYGLMRALESAGDIATLARVWYDATIKQMKKETGMQVPSWSRASAETRLDVLVWGLTNGVDFQTLAEGVGQWWIGERIGAILGPTVRAPGDDISANVRHYQVTQAFRDALA